MIQVKAATSAVKSAEAVKTTNTARKGNKLLDSHQKAFCVFVTGYVCRKGLKKGLQITKGPLFL